MNNKNTNAIKLVIVAAVTLLLLNMTNVMSLVFAQAEVGEPSEPSDVENLKATPGDSEVRLTWEARTNDSSIVGYKIYRGTHSVQSTEDRYDLPSIPVGNVQSYTVKNLTNGHAYYFTMTAVNSIGGESPNYAFEASATPQSGLRLASIEDDGKAPQVKSVSAEDIVTVLVVFSEPVKLPEEHPTSAFQIEKSADQSELAVQKAEIDARDETGQTIVLTTAPQTGNAAYVLTAGIEIQDMYGNPIISGTSDTGAFTGSEKMNDGKLVAETAAAPGASLVNAADTEAPTMLSGSADFDNRISVTFSEKVQLPENPVDHVTIMRKGTEEALGVINVSLSVDGTVAYITTDPQKAVEYEVHMSGVTDLAGNALPENSATVTVTGRGSSIEDLVPPEDITNLIAVIKDAKTNLVELRWEPSKNSAGDLADQLLYQSAGKNSSKFEESTSLGVEAAGAHVEDLAHGKWYTFKVTTKDQTGNESVGVMTSLFLPKTGPGVLAGGLTSILMALFSRSRKKRREEGRGR